MSSNLNTPPHFPTYNIHMSAEEIDIVIETIFPGENVTNVTQLAFDKSYNNRIYDIDVQTAKPSPGATNVVRHYTLKVIGHYFDHRKVENEVACLRILSTYCPIIPVPNVVAWSNSGQYLETIDGQTIQPVTHGSLSNQGWILMLRLPGRTLSVADLDSEAGNGLLRQLAGYITMWRQNIPVVSASGNLRMQTCPLFNEATTVFRDLASAREFRIEGYLLLKNDIANSLPHYKAMAYDQILRLHSDPHYAQLKQRLGREVEKWVEETLPQYAICHTRDFRFTWMDLAPRNILVSETVPTRITGLLDFEFAGFFPAEEEFLNAAIRQEDDWERRHWSVIVDEMARLGEKVPPGSVLDQNSCFDKTRWLESCAIARIVDRMAPWEIREVSSDETELARESEHAEKLVRSAMKDLETDWLTHSLSQAPPGNGSIPPNPLEEMD